jgi:hypothetical protein
MKIKSTFNQQGIFLLKVNNYSQFFELDGRYLKAKKASFTSIMVESIIGVTSHWVYYQ